MSEVTQRIAGLSPKKRALLELLLREKGVNVAGGTTIIARQREADTAPLSFAQKRLWLLDQLQPGKAFYNVPAVSRFPFLIDVTALRLSLNEIVRRHEILRTTFPASGGKPLQRIAPTLTLPLNVIDLGHLGAAEREPEAMRLAEEEAQGQFDLAQGPLLRATLVRLAESDYMLLLTMHHIISDGWSMRVFFRELSTLYDAFLSGRPSPLKELPIQYSDFAQWQREWLKSGVLEQQLSYWKKQLGDVPAVFDLPADRPRPPMQSFSGAATTLRFPEDLTRRLRALSQQESATMFMTMLAAFKALLARYTEQADIVVGTPIAGRTRVELEELIGFFVNTLVLRTDLSGDPSFLELVRRVREVTVEAYAHQDVPFEKLVEELHPERTLSYNPLFQVMFTMQNATAPNSEVQQAAAAPVAATANGQLAGEAPAAPQGDQRDAGTPQLDNGTSKFDLSLSLFETDHEMLGAIEYNTDLFDADRIGRLLDHFTRLVTDAAFNPTKRLSELALIDDEERRQLVQDFSENATRPRTNQTSHEFFEAQARRTPEAPAVVFKEEVVSFGELNRRANRLAHYLRCQGVGAEARVGLCVERNVEMVVGMLGILKAGGAYVPLEPGYPAHRLSSILADAGAEIIVTQEHLLKSLPEDHGRHVLLDALREEIDAQSDGDIASLTGAENLACVVYASDAGGNPKGVALTHRALCRLALEADIVELLPSDVVAQTSDLSLDTLAFEVFAALLHGSQLILMAEDPALFPQEFAAQVRERNISTVFVTTSTFNYLAREVPWSFKTVRNVLFGGDSAEPRGVGEVLKKSSPQRLVNTHGATEAGLFFTAYTVEAEADTILIGRPLANTRIYILDRNLTPAPIGIPGEIYVGGGDSSSLCRGYFNRAETTAGAFIPDPFSREPGARMFRTGDIGRFRPDGNIEYMGRRDKRIKIFGFPVEPEEIEGILTQHPGVREAAVLTRRDSLGDKRLAAYVVAEPEQLLTSSLLRSYVKERLPSHMVPAAFVSVDALPRTADGGVAYHLLPELDEARPELKDEFTPPSNSVEAALAKIWAEVFGLKQVGINDNFFHLGGHSLLATQVISRARDAFRTELYLCDLFESPTVAKLAAKLTEDPEKKAGIERAAQLMINLDQLSEEELDVLLARRRAAGAESAGAG